MAPTIVASAAMSHFVTLVVGDDTLQREAIADLLAAELVLAATGPPNCWPSSPTSTSM
jgi:hypothetical protein